MVSIQIPDVPDDVHAELVRRAEAAGESLDAFVLHKLCEAVNMVEFDAEYRAQFWAEIRAYAETHPDPFPPGWTTREIRRQRDAVAGDR